jgi:hypothetical protein
MRSLRETMLRATKRILRRAMANPASQGEESKEAAN